MNRLAAQLHRFFKSLRAARCPILITLSLLALLTAASCNSVSDSDLIAAGAMLLKHEIESSYRDEFRWYWQPPWQDTSESTGKLDNERMPDWASDRYVACVYWQDDFLHESSIAQPGPDLERVRRGTGWGWILLSAKLDFHILETNLRWTVSEDGVETESGDRAFISAWDDPGVEE
ncbi:hypothetical protein ACFLSZ_01810 [Candidatus Bipolaricaulota bacterium]